MRWLWLPLTLLGLALVAWGVRLHEGQETYRHATVLCTACIGLE